MDRRSVKWCEIWSICFVLLYLKHNLVCYSSHVYIFSFSLLMFCVLSVLLVFLRTNTLFIIFLFVKTSYKETYGSLYDVLLYDVLCATFRQKIDKYSWYCFMILLKLYNKSWYSNMGEGGGGGLVTFHIVMG